MDAILDTSVVIEIFKGNSEILKRLRSSSTIYGISVITLFELYCGSLKEKEEILLEKIPKLEFDEKSAKLAGKIFKDLKSKGMIPKVKDLLIASSAIAHSKKLYTCDTDFKIFKDYGLDVAILKA